ncbi:hypothetical protein [Treponema sp.]|uniref:hypothetical protein n=1 Tax=Treponema sp. TaxID=166 RepID=UPI003F0BF164
MKTKVHNINIERNTNTNIKNIVKKLLPLAGVIIALLVQVLVPDSSSHPVAKRPYYTAFLTALPAIPFIAFVLSFFFHKISEYLERKGHFWLGAALVVTAINFITAKFALLPVIFFPSFDNILAIFVESWQLVLKCIFYSFKLLIFGVFWGVLAGFVPSRSLGKKTFEAAARQLQVAGILKPETDIARFVETGYIELPGVPDG